MKVPNSKSPWYRRLRKGLGKASVGVMLDIIERSDHVIIFKSDEAWGQDDYHYVIEGDGAPGFWLNAFKAKEEAIQFCQDMDWPMKVE